MVVNECMELRGLEEERVRNERTPSRKHIWTNGTPLSLETQQLRSWIWMRWSLPSCLPWRKPSSIWRFVAYRKRFIGGLTVSLRFRKTLGNSSAFWCFSVWTWNGANLFAPSTLSSGSQAWRSPIHNPQILLLGPTSDFTESKSLDRESGMCALKASLLNLVLVKDWETLTCVTSVVDGNSALIGALNDVVTALGNSLVIVWSWVKC